MIDYENARRKAKQAAKRHLKLNPIGATIGSAVDIAISIYNAEIGDAADKSLDLGKPSDIEVIAEQLAKAEDRLAIHVIAAEDIKALHQRIDRVAEIIGERVSGLVDRMTVIENGDAQDYDYVLKGLDEVRLRAGLGTMQAEHPRGGPAFPTGGAHTAEAAAGAVLPVPQRGDRVRLEGAKTVQGQDIPNGWYDVVGQDGIWFQYKSTFGGLFWVVNNSCGLKEVIHHG